MGRRPRNGRARQVAGLLLAAASVQAGSVARAAEWLPTSEAQGRAGKAGLLRCTLVGRRHCPYTPAARAAFDSLPASLEARFVFSYVELSTANMVDAVPVSYVPTLLFHDRAGREMWRQHAPSEGGQLADILQGVLARELSWSQQVKRWRRGRLNGTEELRLADAFANRGKARRAAAVYRAMLASPDTLAPDRQTASREMAYLSTSPKRETPALRAHLERYPDDWEARVNLLNLQIRRGKPDESLRSEIEGSVARLDPTNELAASVLRLPGDYVVLCEPNQCAWALPYTEQLLALNPKDGLALQDVLIQAELCGNIAAAEAALRGFREAYQEAGMPQEKRARFGSFVQAFVVKAHTVVQTLRASTGDPE